jgi:hypothetical protein
VRVEEVKEKCGAVIQSAVCECVCKKKSGHFGKHFDFDGTTWTDAGAARQQKLAASRGEQNMSKTTVTFILSKLERGSDGLTVAELLDNADSTPETLQTLSDLESEGLITSEQIVGRGEIYRLRAFANLEELCQKMPRTPGQSVIL